MSKTLEYAFDDYCIALMAQKLGRLEIADDFFRRAMNYKNVYNPKSGFMQPRDSHGDSLKDLIPKIIPNIYAKVMPGNITGPCSMILTV